ncbi:MAG: hypothetical protein KJZ65_06180 [Phycisphaerales bacterium]|nr:hypothetical protein [Phycisphaerales bacterium]
MKQCMVGLATLGGVAALTGLASAGPDWTEVGDAGSTISSAQAPRGEGQIRSLSGRLGGRGEIEDFEDLYYIGIASPTTFRLELTSPDFNAQLFVFHITLSGSALGLLANDNADEETYAPLILPYATDGTGVTLDLPGIYLIAVAGSGRMPVSSTGQIFRYDSNTEISGADGPGGLNRHIGWVGEGEVGTYRVQMEGTVFPEVPAPGSLGVLALGGLIACRRRA